MKKTLCALVLAACGGGGGGETTTATNPEIDAPMSTPIDAPGTSSDPDATTMGSPDASVQPAANDTCAQAKTIDLTQSGSLTIAATTVGAKADLQAPCGTGGQADVFYKFSLTRRELVYADTLGGTGNSTLYFASACDTVLTKQTTPGDALCSSDACGTTQAQVVALLDPGTYYLVLAGDGATNIHLQHAQVGSGTTAQLPKGQTTLTGTTSGIGTLQQCDAAGPENAYWWKTCSNDSGGAFQGSTCGQTSFDTIVSLQMPGTNTVVCDDDTCSFQSTVNATIPAGAGLYVLAVDGFSQTKKGSYTLTSNRP